MDDLLIVAPNDRLYEALERRLADCYAIRRRWSVDQIQPLVDQGQVSILLLDYPADDEPICGFLRQQEQRFWLTLIHFGAPQSGPISDAPPPINFSFRLDHRS